jgi:hypothetical protein
MASKTPPWIVSDPDGRSILLRSELEVKVLRLQRDLHNSNLRLTLGLADPVPPKRRPKDCSSFCLQSSMRWIQSSLTGEMVPVLGNNAKNFIEKVATRRSDMPFSEKQFAQLLDGTYKPGGKASNSYTEHCWGLMSEPPVDAGAQLLALQAPPGPVYWLTLPRAVGSAAISNRRTARASCCPTSARVLRVATTDYRAALVQVPTAVQRVDDSTMAGVCRDGAESGRQAISWRFRTVAPRELPVASLPPALCNRPSLVAAPPFAQEPLVEDAPMASTLPSMGTSGLPGETVCVGSVVQMAGGEGGGRGCGGRGRGRWVAWARGRRDGHGERRRWARRGARLGWEGGGRGGVSQGTARA